MPHLSTRWAFASIRKLALSSIEPPSRQRCTIGSYLRPHIQSIIGQFLRCPLCRRTAPLALSVARQIDIEDIVLVATVREDIRVHALRIDAIGIPRRVEAVQAGKLTIYEDIVIPPGGRKSVMVHQEPISADEDSAYLSKRMLRVGTSRDSTVVNTPKG